MINTVFQKAYELGFDAYQIAVLDCIDDWVWAHIIMLLTMGGGQ